MNAITQKLEKFATERNWEQFHSPKNLIMALVHHAKTNRDDYKISILMYRI